MNHMDKIAYSIRLASFISEAIQDRKLSILEVSKKTAIPYTTLDRRLKSPETSYLSVTEVVALADALKMNFVDILRSAESSALAKEER